MGFTAGHLYGLDCTGNSACGMIWKFLGHESGIPYNMEVAQRTNC